MIKNKIRICLDRFPEGRTHAVTFSYDDGRIQDKRLVEILNKYSLKGTFHLNSCNMPAVYPFLKDAKYVSPDEIKDVYRGHEVSCHTVTHPFLCDTPDAAIVGEITDNKEFIEKYSGQIVRGMSYPFGQYDERVINICRACGMEYSRTASSSFSFSLPLDFMRWQPSFHHSHLTNDTVDSFLARPLCPAPRLLYIWGHSYEFDECNDADAWKKFEDFCSYVSGRNEIWYATNIEFYDYVCAARSLRFSADCSIVYNPSSCDVWFSADGRDICVKGGATSEL